METLAIDLERLAMAFDDASYERSYYLDRETGEVLIHSDDMPLEEMLEADQDTTEGVAAFEQRYILVPHGDSREGYEDMEAFIATVDDPVLQGKLEVAIQGSGAFRRFKNVLLGEPERERWFSFKSERQRQRVLEWLESENIQPVPR